MITRRWRVYHEDVVGERIGVTTFFATRRGAQRYAHAMRSSFYSTHVERVRRGRMNERQLVRLRDIAIWLLAACLFTLAWVSFVWLIDPGTWIALSVGVIVVVIWATFDSWWAHWHRANMSEAEHDER